MTKLLLEFLSNERLKESRLLLDQKYYSGAYYLAGYAVECALKACIAKQINLHEVPGKDFVNKFYVHNLNTLVGLAGVEQERKVNESIDSDFAINWGIVKDWNESSRYLEWKEQEAKQMYNAIESSKGGILLWIQQYW